VQSQKGVLKALLVTEEGTVAASSLQDDDIDQLGVLANLQALTGLCTDVSKYANSVATLYKMHAVMYVCALVYMLCVCVC
jgi:hypothetical protein